MTKSVFILFTFLTLTSCRESHDELFIGSWKATTKGGEEFLIHFYPDKTFHYELVEDGQKAFGGVFYTIPEHKVIVLDNRDSKIDGDGVGKYIFNDNKLEMIFTGLLGPDTLALEKTVR